MKFIFVYIPFLGAGLQYWRRLVETQARSEVDVVGGELLPWHNLRKIKVEERLGKSRDSNLATAVSPAASTSPCKVTSSSSQRASTFGIIKVRNPGWRQHLIAKAHKWKTVETSAVSASVSQPLKKRLLPPCTSSSPSSAFVFTMESKGLRLVDTKWEPTA